MVGLLAETLDREVIGLYGIDRDRSDKDRYDSDRHERDVYDRDRSRGSDLIITTVT